MCLVLFTIGRPLILLHKHYFECDTDVSWSSSQSYVSYVGLWKTQLFCAAYTCYIYTCCLYVSRPAVFRAIVNVASFGCKFTVALFIAIVQFWCNSIYFNCVCVKVTLWKCCACFILSNVVTKSIFSSATNYIKCTLCPEGVRHCVVNFFPDFAPPTEEYYTYIFCWKCRKLRLKLPSDTVIATC